MTDGERKLRQTLAASCGTCCVLTASQLQTIRDLLASGKITDSMVRSIGWDGLADQVSPSPLEVKK